LENVEEKRSIFIILLLSLFEPSVPKPRLNSIKKNIIPVRTSTTVKTTVETIIIVIITITVIILLFELYCIYYIVVIAQLRRVNVLNSPTGDHGLFLSSLIYNNDVTMMISGGTFSDGRIPLHSL